MIIIISLPRYNRRWNILFYINCKIWIMHLYRRTDYFVVYLECWFPPYWPGAWPWPGRHRLSTGKTWTSSNILRARLYWPGSPYTMTLCSTSVSAALMNLTNVLVLDIVSLIIFSHQRPLIPIKRLSIFFSHEGLLTSITQLSASDWLSVCTTMSLSPRPPEVSRVVIYFLLGVMTTSPFTYVSVPVLLSWLTLYAPQPGPSRVL